MKKLCVLAFCTAFAGLIRAESFDPSGFSKMLEIRASAGSVAPGVVLSDFQALVRLSENIEGFLYSDFRQENGADLAFFDADKNLLAHEIDTWNVDGESLVWVKIPAFRRGMKIYMVYGNAAYESAVSPSDTWSGFTGVWHMREAEGVVADATGHGLSATPSGPRAEHNIGIEEGVVGMARKNGGIGSSAAGDRAYLSVPSYDSFALGDTFTASGFFRVTDDSGWYRLFSRRGPGGWGQEVDCNDAEIVSVYGAEGSSPTVNIPGLVGKWTYLTFSYCGSACKVYANGKFVDTLAITPATDNGAPLAIGCTAYGDDWCLYGDYDEVRLCGGNLSAERIAADYATATQAGFFDYFAVENCSLEVVDPSGFAKFLKITASAAAVPSGVTLPGFPVLVRLSENIEGFSYSDFMPNGADLVFADDAGRVLASEIDTWNPDGESLVWVKVPFFRNGMTLVAYWGAAGASPVAPSGTWSEFTGVWHMKEAEGVVEDATGHGLSATPSGPRAEHNIGIEEGVVGMARQNGGTGGSAAEERAYLSIPDYDSFALGDTFTASGFFRVTAECGWYRLFSRRGPGGGWGQEVDCGDAEIVYVYGAGEPTPTVRISGLVGEWVHLAFAYSGSTCKVYANGELVDTLGISPATDNGAPLSIGCTSDGNDWCLFGDYDEARLCRGNLSAERIAADYATATKRDFFAYGAVGASAANPPVMAEPVLSRNEQGELMFSVATISGEGSLVALFETADETADEKVEFAVSGNIAAGGRKFVCVVPVDRLSSGKSYTVSAVGINSAGGRIVVDSADTFYCGTLSVEKTADAAEDGPIPGTFTISRADTYCDLSVNYSFGGTAVAGVDYVGSAVGSVTIPAGASSATVSVVPKVNSALNADTTVDFAFADGFYLPSGAAASMKIENLAPIKWRAFKEFIEFTFPMESLAAGETLENFPVLIRLSEEIDGFKYSAFKLKRGGDMMFTDAARKAIPSEITTWNEEGTSLVWVSVPVLAKGTRIRMYYGNGVNPAGVFVGKWPDYAGVWHLEEASGTAYDSTANAFDALAKQNKRAWPEDLVAVADGAVGSGRVNQNSTTWYDVGSYDEKLLATARRNYLCVSSKIDQGLNRRFSFSGWFRTTGGTEWQEILACKSHDGYKYGWNVSRMCAPGSTDMRIRVDVADGGGEFTIPDMRNEWVHLLVSMDCEGTGEEDDPLRSVASVYANGEFLGKVAGSTCISENSNDPLTFGNIDSLKSGDAFYGQYDELRLKSKVSTLNWAKAEYLTVVDPSFAIPSAAALVCDGFKIVIR